MSEQVNALKYILDQRHSLPITVLQSKITEEDKNVQEVQGKRVDDQVENPVERGVYRGLTINGEKHVYVLASEIKRICGYIVEVYKKKSINRSFNEDQIRCNSDEIKISYNGEQVVNVCVLKNILKGLLWQEYQNCEGMINCIVECVKEFEKDEKYKDVEFVKNMQKFVENSENLKQLVIYQEQAYKECKRVTYGRRIKQVSLQQHIYINLLYGLDDTTDRKCTKEALKIGTSKDENSKRFGDYLRSQDCIIFQAGYRSLEITVERVKEIIGEISVYERELKKEGNLDCLRNCYSIIDPLSEDVKGEYEWTERSLTREVIKQSFEWLKTKITTKQELVTYVNQMENFFGNARRQQKLKEAGENAPQRRREQKNGRMQRIRPYFRYNGLFNKQFDEKQEMDDITNKKKRDDFCTFSKILKAIQYQYEDVLKKYMFELEIQFFQRHGRKVKKHNSGQKVQEGEDENIEYYKEFDEEFKVQAMKLVSEDKVLREIQYRLVYKMVIYARILIKKEVQKKYYIEKTVEERTQVMREQIERITVIVQDQQKTIENQQEIIQQRDEDIRYQDQENRELRREKDQIEKDSNKRIVGQQLIIEAGSYLYETEKYQERGGITRRQRGLIRQQEEQEDIYSEVMQRNMSERKKNVIKNIFYQVQE